MKIIDVVTRIMRRAMRSVAIFLNDVSVGKIKPDMISWLSIAGHLPVVYFIAEGKLIAAAGFLVVFGLFDTLDGELARLQKSARPAGMILDATLDRVKETLIYTGIIGYFVNNNYSLYAIYLAALALGMSLTATYLKAKAEVALSISKNYKDHHKLNRALTDGLLQFEVRMSLLLVGLLLDQLVIVCGIIAALMSITVVGRLISIERIVDK